MRSTGSDAAPPKLVEPAHTHAANVARLPASPGGNGAIRGSANVAVASPRASSGAGVVTAGPRGCGPAGRRGEQKGLDNRFQNSPRADEAGHERGAGQLQQRRRERVERERRDAAGQRSARALP
jgi:hypothetical protein